eukprot:CAMPEP_0174270450 /NCGR_PEP_ID=MMETSP0439-20130205/44469_1 /TAXON_ID=0 /ORGANISM="Stereomyxa ramosa, Strain Chinc5" /LENGTH=128 /DNA_ID=CAMNT_0015359783 /DNA_START=52 /DNA_END=435 /DNA_ORIENTATION=+
MELLEMLEGAALKDFVENAGEAEVAELISLMSSSDGSAPLRRKTKPLASLDKADQALFGLVDELESRDSDELILEDLLKEICTRKANKRALQESDASEFLTGYTNHHNNTENNNNKTNTNYSTNTDTN